LDKVRSVDQARRVVERLHARGKRVVFTNGCFELLHVGHIRYLQAARDLGDALIVGLNSDASVRALKGAPRPLVPQAERAELLAALACVDDVVIFAEPTAETLVEALRPDVYVKGGDYRSIGETSDGGAAPAPRKVAPEMAVVQRYGGQVVVLPYSTGHSTTTLIENILQSYNQPG
jgi:D-beta-D-heptose 7-phosphate kinase/D-beta-D-heptose 1-phosphate adenosyltransferase